MRFVVGGVVHDISAEQVVRAVRDKHPEPVREHVVDIEGRLFPPKQVFAAVTGRDRGTFTTQEAQRVLTRLEFHCRRYFEPSDGGTPELVHTPPAEDLAEIRAEIGTLQAAIAGLHFRLEALEAAS